MNDWDKQPLFRTWEEGQRPVQLSILGEFVLSHSDGRQFLIATKKNRALLAILALSPGFQATRERLCGLLWGDRGEEQARSSLRQSLAVLRKELGQIEELVLKTHDDIVALRMDTLQVDAVEFLAQSNTSEITLLREATQFYRGELLTDTSIKDTVFEDWLSAERSRLMTVAIKIFDRLIPLEEGHSRIDSAQLLVSLDPMRESSHRLLMQAYADQGDIGLALKQFELCRKLLHEELSVEPAWQTLELMHRISDVDRKSITQENNQTDPSQAMRTERLPSIAVLPFVNLSGDQLQDYLAEGIAEDIITELGRFSSLLVIGRNSSFRYRGGPLDFLTVGKELGVSYLVSGSIRRIGEKVRIGAQLIEAKSGNHLWSERYDHALSEIFEVQDDVVRAVVATTEHRIADTESDGNRSKPPSDLVAYDYLLRARQLMEYFDRHLEAETYLKHAVELAPNFSEPYSLLAHLEIYKYFLDGKTTHIAIAGDLAQRALVCDDRSSNAHDAIGFVSCFTREYDFARFHFDRALALNPNNIRALSNSAMHLTWTGKYQDALRRLDIILARDPFPPNWYWDIRGSVLFQLKRYPEAIEAYNNVVDKQYWEYAYIIAALAHSGNQNRAVAQVAELERRYPGTTIARVIQVEVYADEMGRQHLIDGLLKAGLPDELSAS